MRVDLALVGFGNVGRRFARLLDEQRDRLARDHDLECRIVGIATRRHGAVFDAAGSMAGCRWRIEPGRRLDDLPDASTALRQSGAWSLELIDASPAPSAALRVVVETTTLDIERGTARNRSRRGGARTPAATS